MAFFFLLLVIGAVATVVYFGSAHTRDTLNEAWSIVAHRFGLSLKPAETFKQPRLEGIYQGYPMSVDIQNKSSGKNNQPSTRYIVGYPHLRLGLELKQEGFMSSVAKVFGGKDIEIGDASFDSKVLIKGNDPEVVREYLTRERRDAILAFMAAHPGSVINDEGVAWMKAGRVNNAEQISATLTDMLTVARALSPVEVEPETAVDPAMMADAEFTEPEPEPEPDPIVAPAGGTPVPAFCAAVFAGSALSFEAAKIFRERFEGQAVSWSGELLSAKPYRFDFVFGSGGGIKAEFAIDRLEAVRFGDGTVKAVVQLPEHLEGLEARTGETMHFTGTLVKVDGLKREVFVCDGSLVEA